MGGSPIHDALRTLAPIDISEIPTDPAGLQQFLQFTFKDATILIDSVPLQDPSDTSSTTRSSRSSSSASCSSEIVLSDARPEPPTSDVEKLQKDWGKPVRLKANENPLGMSVYKLAGNDGKGAWFARRSVHEGLGFSKWKKALQSEFAETLKGGPGPGDGNIRGIGGEKRVECRECGEVGKLEVWDLTAQFPGPTTPREFVEAVCTSNCKTTDGRRQFMIVSKPCKHPEAPERDGMIRGQYQSVEIIREIPTNRPKSSGGRIRAQSSALGREAAIRNAEQSGQPTRSASADGRKRAKTDGEGALAQSDGADDEGDDTNPVEWIMLTRSDPGGSVPRFMVERGTPGSIVADAAKFLDWACAVQEDELEDAAAAVQPPEAAGVAAGAAAAADTANDRPLKHEKKYKEKRPPMTAYESNGHLAGLEGRDEGYVYQAPEQQEAAAQGGIFSTVTGALGGAASVITSRLPVIPIPGYSAGRPHADERERRYSTSSSSSSSSGGSFTSARDRHHLDSDSDDNTVHHHTVTRTDTLGTDTTTGTSGTEPFPPLSGHSTSDVARPTSSGSKSVEKVGEKEEKERSKFERKKNRLTEKLSEQLVKIRQRETSHGSQESAESNEKAKEEEKRNENIRKAEEKYEREVRRQEEKFRKEMAKLREKREREERREIEREVKEKGKSEVQQLKQLLDRERHECQVLKVERDLLRKQVGELQRENTRLAVGVGKLPGGEALLNEVRLKREEDKEGVLIDGTRSPAVGKENIAMR